MREDQPWKKFNSSIAMLFGCRALMRTWEKFGSSAPNRNIYLDPEAYGDSHRHLRSAARTSLKNLCPGSKPPESVKSYFNRSPETALAVLQSSIPILEGSSNSVSERVGFRILGF